jgi:hypothetical protein
MPYMRGLGSVAVTIPDYVNPCRPIPARFILFTDAGSVGHVLSGVLAGIVPPPWNLGVLCLFGGYELSKLNAGESAARTGGKFIEFGLGLLGVGLIAALGGKW